MFHLKRTVCPLLVLATLASAGAAQAATYWVAKTGSDSNACSAVDGVADPGTYKLTIAGGIGCLAAGDTLIIKNGTYVELINDSIPSGGGSWATATTVRAQNARGVTLRPASGSRVLYFRGTQAGVRSYIIVSGLILDGINVSFDTVKIDSADGDNASIHHIRLADCEIMNSTTAQGVLAGGQFHELLDLTVHDNGDSNLDHGLYLSGNNMLVSGGEFYNHFGGGIQLASFPVSDHTVEKVRAHHNLVGIIATGTPGRFTVRNNIIYANTGGGIGANDSTNGKFYHNTAYGNGGQGISATNHNGIQVINNISYGNIGANISITNSTGATVQNNTTANPSFVDANNGNFSIQSNSIAIDAGLALPEVKLDFAGTLRPQGAAYDIGAYEILTSGSPAPPVASPTGLTVQ